MYCVVTTAAPLANVVVYTILVVTSSVAAGRDTPEDAVRDAEDVVGLAGVVDDVSVVGTEALGSEDVVGSTGILDVGTSGVVVGVGGSGTVELGVGLVSGSVGALGVCEGVGVGVGVG